MVQGKEGVIAVVGGGTAGCEVAANVAALVAGSRLRVMLVTQCDRLWSDAPQAAARRLLRELAVRGVDIVLDTTIVGSTGRCILAADGRRFVADHVVLATGLRVAPVIHAAMLPSSDRGIRVGPYLYSVADPRVFAVGDCANLPHRPLAWQGMHDSRGAAVLAHNLIAGLCNRPYRRYRPARHPWVILNLGDGTAIGYRGRVCWHGRSVLWWKRRLDARFMARLASRQMNDSEQGLLRG